RHALVELQRLIGGEGGGDHIDDAVVELGGEVGDVGIHRGGAHHGDHFCLGLVVAQYCYFLAGSLGQRVDFLVVDEDIGGADGGYAHDGVGLSVHLRCHDRVGKQRQHSAEFFRVLDGADGIG